MSWLSKSWAWLDAQFGAIDRDAGALTQGGLPDRRTGVVIVTVTLVLGFMQYVARSADVKEWLAALLMTRFGLAQGLTLDQVANRIEFLETLVWVTGAFVGYILVPLFVIRFVLRQRLSEFGLIPSGYWRHLPMYVGLFLPVFVGVVAVSGTDGFRATYPFYRDPESWTFLLIWELLYGLQFVGLEVFFRGFLLHGLKHRYGSAALWIMLLPYVMIHFTKPVLEASGAVVAGIVLGLLSLRTRSIWGGVTIHVAVAWAMDALVLYQTGWSPGL